MKRMTEGERSAWVAALARRIRRLARAVGRRGPARARPDPPGRQPPAGPAEGGR
jgi:hypothetical protein